MCLVPLALRDVATKYNIKYFYDITDRTNFRANPDYKGVCHVALAQVRGGRPGRALIANGRGWRRAPRMRSTVMVARRCFPGSRLPCPAAVGAK
jgi:hypothetical protein